MNAFEFETDFNRNTIKIPSYYYSIIKKFKKGKVIILIPDKEKPDISEGIYSLSGNTLSAAYSDNEPDYTHSMIDEPNPTYERR